MYSHTRTNFGAEVHKSNIRVKRWHNKYKNSELDWKTQLLFKWFAYQAQSYWNTDFQSRGTNFWDILYIHHFHIDNNASCLPPKILQNHCFQFLQCITVVPREIEDNGYAKLWGVNKVRYGLCKNGELLVLFSIIQF